jgi:hypothetical protein
MWTRGGFAKEPPTDPVTRGVEIGSLALAGTVALQTSQVTDTSRETPVGLQGGNSSVGPLRKLAMILWSWLEPGEPDGLAL